MSLSAAWILIILSAVGRSFEPLYSLSSLLINEFLPNFVFFTLFYLMSEDKKFINTISNCMIPIMIGVISIEMLEVYNQKNPLLQYGSSFDERFIPNILRNNKYRAFSTFPHPLVLGEFLSFGCSFCLFSMTNGTKTKKLLSVATIMAALMGAYYTNTRSTVVSCAIAIFAYFIFRYLSSYTFKFGKSKIKFLYCVLSIFIMCLTVLVWPILTPILAGKTSDEIKSTVARAYMHSEGLPHIFDAFNGYGYGMSLKIAGLVTENSLGLDDYFLFVALNSGFIAAFLLIIVAIFMINLASSKPQIFNNDFDKSALIGSISIIWLFNGFIQSIPSVHFFFYAALGYALGRTELQEGLISSAMKGAETGRGSWVLTDLK